jgi:hypothetical protein
MESQCNRVLKYNIIILRDQSAEKNTGYKKEEATGD